MESGEFVHLESIEKVLEAGCRSYHQIEDGANRRLPKY